MFCVGCLTCRLSLPAGSCSPAPSRPTLHTLCRRWTGRPDSGEPELPRGALEAAWRCLCVPSEVCGRRRRRSTRRYGGWSSYRASPLRRERETVTSVLSEWTRRNKELHLELLLNFKRINMFRLRIPDVHRLFVSTRDIMTDGK